MLKGTKSRKGNHELPPASMLSENLSVGIRRCIVIIVLLINGCTMTKPREVITVDNVQSIRLLAEKHELGFADFFFAPLDVSTAGVWDIAFSPDSKLLAVAANNFYYVIVGMGNQRFLKLYDADTLRLIQKLNSENNSNVAFSPGGDLIASLGGRDVIEIRNVSTGERVGEFKFRPALGISRALAFSPTKQIVACVAGDGYVQIWDTLTKRRIAELKYPEVRKTEIAFSPDGTVLAIAISRVVELNDEVHLWNVETGKEVKTIKGNFGLITSLVFAPNAKTLVWGETRKAPSRKEEGGATITFLIRFVDVQSGLTVEQLEDVKDAVASVSFSSDGELLGVCLRDETIGIWNLGTKELVLTLKNPHGRGFSKAVFRPDGKAIAATDGEWVYIYGIP